MHGGWTRKGPSGELWELDLAPFPSALAPPSPPRSSGPSAHEAAQLSFWQRVELDLRQEAGDDDSAEDDEFNFDDEDEDEDSEDDDFDEEDEDEDEEDEEDEDDDEDDEEEEEDGDLKI